MPPKKMKTSKTCSINCLPDEIFVHIFSFLELGQKLDASLVCRRWLGVFDSWTLMKSIHVTISDPCQWSHLCSPSRRFGHFKILELCLSADFEKFVESNKEYIHSLSFSFCQLDTKHFHPGKLISSCPQLKELYTIKCHPGIFHLFPSLSCLEYLTVAYCRELRDIDFDKLIDTTSQLKAITFDIGCVDTYDLFCDSDDGRRVHIEEQVSFQSLEDLVNKNSGTLEEISCPNLPQRTVLKIANITAGKLKKFYFDERLQDESFVREICACQPSLTSFQFHAPLKPILFQHITQMLPNLQSLHFLAPVSAEILHSTFQLRQIKEVLVNHCDSLTVRAVRRIQSTDLRKVFFRGKKTFPNSMATFLLQTNHIQHLTLSGIVTNEILWTISSTLPDLTFLYLEDSVKITDDGLQGREDVEASTSISNLKRLKHLKLFLFDNITEYGVTKSIQFPFLVVLEIAHCRNIKTNIRPSLLKQNPHLRSLTIA